MTAKSKIILIKFALSCFFILVSLLSYSQDLIIKRDSSKIFCEIIKEDSASIYYKQVKGDAVFKLSINKSEVLKYYNSKAMVQSQIRKADSIAKANPEPAFKNDSIFYSGKKTFIYHDKKYGSFGVRKLMKDGTEAHQEMNKAIVSGGFWVFFSAASAPILGAFAADAIVEGNPRWTVLGVGIGFTGLSFAFKYFYQKHADKAVSLYNSKLKIAGTAIPKFEIGMATRGLGVSLKF